MSLTTTVILIGLAILTLWGAVAPRAQWRVLAGWTRSNAYASEPGPVSVGVHRVVSIVATIVLIFAGVALYQQHRAELSANPAAPSALEKMWGAPAPKVVNRVIVPMTTAPEGLVNQPILSYQPIDGSRRVPAYLFDLKNWAPKNATDDSGLAGAAPSAGLTGLDSASIVLHVRGDRDCLPHSVVAIESTKSVELAVFYGRPNTAKDAATVATGDCSPTPTAANSVSVLIPVVLADLVGSRSVVNLDGSAIKATPDLIDSSGL